jgi:acyl dehydratase
MPDPAALTFSEIEVGRVAEFEITLTPDTIATFAALTGDTNPLHMDETFAQETSFKGRVAHGMLGASFFSRLVGMHLPGRDALYLSQKISFKAPLRPNEPLIVRGTVTHTTSAMQIITLSTEILDATTKAVLVEGEAVVRVLSRP